MGRVCRWLLPVLAAMLLAPSAAQPFFSSTPWAKVGGASCLGKPATRRATPGQHLIVGTAGADVIVGTKAADEIRGRGGNDLICGGGGSDLLAGGPGRDRLRGGPGNDFLVGGAGRDECAGNAGVNLYSSCEVVPSSSPGVAPPAAEQAPAPPAQAGPAAVDKPPVAVNDTLTVTEDSGATSIDVLLNDSDSDGGPKIVESVTQPQHGEVSIAADGAGLTYEPLADYCNDGEAADGFTYTLNGGSTATVSVAVECVDDPPVSVNDARTVVENAGATALDVLSNDSDIDGGPRSIESVTQPSNGSVAITGGGSGLTYQPDADYCNDGEAADGFSYTLNGGSTATVSVAVECVTKISISPAALSPAFSPAVSDYTVRCDGSPLEMSGRTAQGASMSVDGEPAASGRFQASVPLEENQEFSFSVTDSSGTNSYFVRCLPSNFPTWEYEQFRPSRSDLYVVAPTLGAGASQYAVIFDRNGVPVWWDTESPGRIINASVLDDGTVVWWRDNHGFIVHSLDGTILGEINTVLGPTDLHELQQEPNGNYLLIGSKVREHIDLTEYGFGPDEEVHDYIVEEVNPQGELVWSWDTGNHIGLAETGRWWRRLGSETPRDIVHMNAIEADGENAVLVSLRHTDAIYKVDKTTGEILWKLGGTWTPKSLQVINDPEGAYPLGGQHDVRLMPDGTITIHDNNTDQPSPPRAVRYEINEAQKTATLVEEVSDPLAPSSSCCGSARRAADGSWLMSWGANSLVTEFDPAGQRTFSLGFGGSVFSYRAVAVKDGLLSASSLRAGMDAMHPR